MLEGCRLCPRECGVNREVTAGYCNGTDKIRVARAALHFWEEPCISGECGSGTVFFSGCNLKCCYCQNYDISHNGFGKDISMERLGEIFLELQEKGAANINLVTPTHYVDKIINVLDNINRDLTIPVVYNTGGYESLETVKRLSGYVDIFLHDIKYYSDDRAIRYSNATDYFNKSTSALCEMIKQVGKPVYDDRGLMKKGVIIRHLVLPGGVSDSINILEWIAHNLNGNEYVISLMSQYTPCYKSFEHKEINRRLTTYEYNRVLDRAIELGLDNGYMQERTSANKEYIPPFDLEGI